MKMRKYFLFIASLCLCSITLLAQDSQNLMRIEIEREFHHIGDEYAAFFKDPDFLPDLQSWESSFWLDKKTLQLATSVHVECVILHNLYSDLLINGRRIGLPYNPNNDGNAYLNGFMVSPTLISIPLGYLHEGMNTIGFESVARDIGYDDMEFGELFLLISLDKDKNR